MKEIKKRQSKMELMRFFAMLFIISHHLMLYELGLWKDLEHPLGDISHIVVGVVLEPFIIIGVNLFFLISGFFRIKSNTKKFIKYILVFYFYIIIITSIGVFTGTREFELWTLFKSVLLYIEYYWYIITYLALMLISPLLNIIIENANERIAKYFIFVYIFLCVYSYQYDLALGINAGYSIVSAASMYLIGGFISKGELLHGGSRRNYNCGYLVLSLINVLLCLLSIKYGIFSVKKLLNYSNPLIIISSMCFFKSFSLIKVVDYAKDLKSSKHGELEIIDLNRIYLENNTHNVELLGQGLTCLILERMRVW